MFKLFGQILLVFSLQLGVVMPVDGQESRSAPNEFIVYACQFSPVLDYERILRKLLSDDEPREIFLDKSKNRLCLRASASDHRLARDLLEKLDVPPKARPTDSNPQSPKWNNENLLSEHSGRPGVPWSSKNQTIPRESDVHLPQRDRSTESESSLQLVPKITRFVSLGGGRMTSTELQMRTIFKNKTTVERLADGRSRYIIRLSSDLETMELEFDGRREGVLVFGPQPAVEQLVKLFKLISVQPSDGYRTQVLNVQRRNQKQVNRLISPAVRLPEKARPDERSTPLSNPNEMDQSSRNVKLPFRVRQASYLTEFKWQDVDDPTNQDETDQDETQQVDSPTIRQFEDVEIETLPDLDVVILRGRDKDLDQLEEIIRQIERISRETQPEIRIYHLQHTGSTAIADIIAETRQDLVSGRQGRVTVTPLVKPNAILLIGWGEAVNAILELARELDTPVDASTQFSVIRIEHASADSISDSIGQFFADRGGLSPQFNIAVDNRTNSLVVHASPRDMKEVTRLVKQLDVAGGRAVNQAVVINIRNSLASDVAQTLEAAITAGTSNSRSAGMELYAFDEKGIRILQSGSLDEVQITPNVRNNTLIVSSPKANLGLLEELIRQIDTPATRSQLKVFKIYNGDASTMIQTLRSLIPGTVGDGANTKLPTAPDEISLVPIRFSVDTRSNSILAMGSEGDLKIIEALIAKLDESTNSQRQTEVYQLKNAPAVDVANAINQFLQNSREIEGMSPGEQNPFQQLEQEVVIVPEPIANKLLLSATPRYFEEINDLIEKLDEQPSQVVVQVLIAEVLLNETDELGVELGLQDSVLFDRSLLGNLLTTQDSTSASTPAGIVTTVQEIIRSATNLPGFGFNSASPLGNSGSTASLGTAGAVAGQGISNFAVGRSNDQMGFGGLVLSASSQNVSILVRALQESRRIEILSRPQIRTLDNQPAFIQVGQRVPRITGSTVNQNGQSNSVTNENVGLILGVTPRIGPDGNVIMEIDAEKSNLGSEQDGIPVAVSNDGTVIRSPRVDTTTAQATVSAADGETIVLGGLITNSTQKVDRSVPFLRDIPVLKHFFKFESYQKRRTELLIVLTPHVIRSSADNARNRNLESSRMSWCASDVFEMQGNDDLTSGINAEQLERETPEVIYPIENPRGSLAPPRRKAPKVLPVYADDQ
ncbi:MAG: general secretion pathway protein D [Mariniblastus sp.]|jgi:general secretion pathway protein D